MMRLHSVFLLIPFAILSCKQHDNKEATCQELLARSRNYLHEFYTTNDSNYLRLSRAVVDSIDCNSFAYKVFYPKVALFYLMKDYENGIAYITSLEEDKFQRPYMKAMFLNHFKAQQCLERSDTACHHSLYLELVHTIENYLNTHKDFDALLDLYVFKSQIYPKENLLHEIDSIKGKGLYNTDYMDALYESVNEGRYLNLRP